MAHYRLYKLAARDGKIITGKDMIEPNDRCAMAHAAVDPDCPACEVWKGTEKIGAIV